MKFAYHATMCPPDQYLPLALAAEAAGFDTFTFPDSICYPKEGSDVYPYNDDGTREFLDGLKLRMKSLAPIHLRRIQSLVDIYGTSRTTAAVSRAQSYRNYNALAVARILAMAHPDVVPDPPHHPLSLGAAALDALDDFETGSPEDYDIDTVPPTKGDTHGQV